MRNPVDSTSAEFINSTLAPALDALRALARGPFSLTPDGRPTSELQQTAERAEEAMRNALELLVPDVEVAMLDSPAWSQRDPGAHMEGADSVLGLYEQAVRAELPIAVPAVARRLVIGVLTNSLHPRSLTDYLVIALRNHVLDALRGRPRDVITAQAPLAVPDETFAVERCLVRMARWIPPASLPAFEEMRAFALHRLGRPGGRSVEDLLIADSEQRLPPLDSTLLTECRPQTWERLEQAVRAAMRFQLVRAICMRLQARARDTSHPPEVDTILDAATCVRARQALLDLRLPPIETSAHGEPLEIGVASSDVRTLVYALQQTPELPSSVLQPLLTLNEMVNPPWSWSMFEQQVSRAAWLAAGGAAARVRFHTRRYRVIRKLHDALAADTTLTPDEREQMRVVITLMRGHASPSTEWLNTDD